jgi:hypothetical protein
MLRPDATGCGGDADPRCDGSGRRAGGCSSEQPASPLPGGGTAAATAPTASARSSTEAARPGATQLSSGAVRLTVRPEDASQARCWSPTSASSPRTRTPSARPTHAPRSCGGAARPRRLPTSPAGSLPTPATASRSAVRYRCSQSCAGAVPGALTVVLDDCLDGTAQQFYDRSGKPTGQAGDRRPIRVELINSPARSAGSSARSPTARPPSARGWDRDASQAAARRLLGGRRRHPGPDRS